MLQGISLKKSVREKTKRKNKTRGDQVSSSEARYFIFKRVFYTLICTQREMKDTRSNRVSPKIPAVLPLSKPGFFLHTFPTNDVVYIIFWPWRPVNIFDPLLIKAAQPENLFSHKVFFLYISNLCQPQKMLNRIMFFTGQRCSELQERTNQLKVLMWLNSRLHLFFLHSHYVN